MSELSLDNENLLLVTDTGSQWIPAGSFNGALWSNLASISGIRDADKGEALLPPPHPAVFSSCGPLKDNALVIGIWSI